MVRQAFQKDITYILTTTGAAKLKRYYEHIFGVTAIFRASTQAFSLTLEIISMSRVLGNRSQFITRHCQISVAAVQDWDGVFPLDRYCMVELQFWKNNL